MTQQVFEPAEWILPNSYQCPITREIMDKPVLASDGHTYDQESIEYWLSNHSTSPVTNAQLPSQKVIPNHTVHTLIEQHRQRLGEELLRTIQTITINNMNHLLDQGGHINVKTPDGSSLLMESVRCRRLDAVVLLLSRGADVTCGSNDQGEDLISLARAIPQEESKQMVELLAPVVTKKLEEIRLAEETRLAQADNLSLNHGRTAEQMAQDADTNDDRTLPEFSQLVNGWNIGWEKGYHPSLFALLISKSFMEAPRELPAANEARMSTVLTKLTLGMLVVAGLIICFL
jgi:hypothetical protein